MAQSGWAGIAKLRAGEHWSSRGSPRTAHRLARSSSGNGCRTFADRSWYESGHTGQRERSLAAIAPEHAPAKLVRPSLPRRKGCSARRERPAPSIPATARDLFALFRWAFFDPEKSSFIVTVHSSLGANLLDLMTPIEHLQFRAASSRRSRRVAREFGKPSRDGEDGEKEQQGIDGMAIAERGVGDVVDEWIESGEDGEGIGEGIFAASEEQDSGDGTESEKQIAKDDDADEERLGTQEFGEWMFGAGPGDNDFSSGKAEEEGGLLLDEGSGESPFFVEVSVFA